MRPLLTEIITHMYNSDIPIWDDNLQTKLVLGGCTEPERLCGSASLTSSKTPPSPRSWRMTPPPSAGWPSWWRTCRRVRSQIPGASLSPRSNILLPSASPAIKNTSAKLPNRAAFNHGHCFYERLWMERLLSRYFSRWRCKLRVWASPVWFSWVPGVKDTFCLIMNSVNNLQINNKLLHNREPLHLFLSVAGVLQIIMYCMCHISQLFNPLCSLKRWCHFNLLMSSLTMAFGV